MLAKLRRKNQITIPKAVIAAFEGAEYFDVAQDNGRIVLAPGSVAPAGAPSERGKTLVGSRERLQIPDLDAANVKEWARKMDPAQTKAVWEKMEKLGVTEQDIADAVEWARRDSYSLSEMLDRIEPHMLHPEQDFGQPQGKEAW